MAAPDLGGFCFPVAFSVFCIHTTPPDATLEMRSKLKIERKAKSKIKKKPGPKPFAKGPAFFDDKQIAEIRRGLLWWYSLHARDLPWRRTRDPYCIWISEIMLQQTRVATVIDRYRAFVADFPTLVSLALAPEEAVLTHWSGLGYYKRARLLRLAAQFVLREHEGSLPRTADQLKEIPGIGPYTSAAIASIAFHEPVAVVDGNVERVITRLLGPGKDGHLPSDLMIRHAATMLLAVEKPGTFNQAMMELGATVCLPRWPRCDKCPVQELCRTQGEHPVKPAKKMRSRQAAYGLVQRATLVTPLAGESALIAARPAEKVEVLLQQRAVDAAQMPGMWELPEVDESIVENMEPILRLSHAITNTNHYVSVYDLTASVEGTLKVHSTQQWADPDQLLRLPLTGLARKVLMRLNIFPRPRSIRTGHDIAASLDPFTPHLDVKGNPGPVRAVRVKKYVRKKKAEE